MPNPPHKPNPSKNRVFTVNCVLNNVIYMTEKTWLGHSVPKHVEQEAIHDLEEIKSTLASASRVRRSTDPYIGNVTGVYERIMEDGNWLMRVPVIFDSETYDQGQYLGKVTSAFMLERPDWNSGQVGGIFWVPPKKDEE